ncbi:MAG: potassium channel protein [Bacteroidota bacterium]|nr:potassium channel protein [Bacteroidota bacterium]
MNKNLAKERTDLLKSIDKLLEGPMIFLGFVWLVLLIVELIWGLTAMLEYLSIAIWIIFIIDFAIKLILAPEKKVFMKKNWLTVISLVVPALRLFRFFRFIQVIRGARGLSVFKVVASLNRSMKSLAATMRRRGFLYVVLLAVVVMVAGAAGMYGIEKGNPGFESYGMALWWTAMRVITAGSEYFPITHEGRGLAFILALFGYAIFGYVTATLATYFIGRDAEEEDTPVAGAKDVSELKSEIALLTKAINELKEKGN